MVWVKCFMKCHPHLCLRKPENTSLTRATGSNQHNVTEFHHNYKKLHVKFKFTTDQIYNLNETGVTAVVQASHIVAQTGVTQVGQVVSVEKGQLITVCTIINATENTLSPVFVFRCAKLHDAQDNQCTRRTLVWSNAQQVAGWQVFFLKTFGANQEYSPEHRRTHPDTSWQSWELLHTWYNALL